MNVWKVVCATLVIFVAGIMTGATLVRCGERGPKHSNRPPATVIATPLPAGLPDRETAPKADRLAPANSALLSREFIQLLERQLRLSKEQREQVDKIMSEGQERIRVLRSGVDPEIRKEMQETRERIRTVLKPGQLELFEKLVKQRAIRRTENQTPVERRGRESRPLNPPQNPKPDDGGNPPPPVAPLDSKPQPP